MATSLSLPRRHGWRIAVILALVAAVAAALLLNPKRPTARPEDLTKVSMEQLRSKASTTPSVPILTTLFERTLKSGDQEGALKLATELVQRFPRESPAHNALGVALASMNKTEGATKEFRLAMSLDPRRVSPYVNLGHLAMKSGDANRARVEYDRATAVDPTSVSAWRGLGDAYKALAERDSANQAYEKAIQLNPNDAQALTDLGTYRAEMSAGSEGRKHLLKAVSLGYRSGKLYAGLAMAFADQPESTADLTKALEYAAEAEKLGDESSLLFYAKALALQRLHRYKEAIEGYQQGISVSPDANGPWLGMSQCFRALGNTKLAEEAAKIGERILNQRQRIGNLKRQIETNPGRLDLRDQYAGILMSNHQYLLAAEQYRYIAQHQAGNAGAWNRVMKAFDLAGRPDLSAMVQKSLAAEGRRPQPADETPANSGERQ